MTMRVDVTVEVGGLRLRNGEIAQLELRQELGAHHLCTLEFTRDESAGLLLEHLLDAPVTVRLTDGAGDHEAFVGQVVGGTQAHLLNAGSRFRLEAASRSLAMQLHRDTGAYENVTCADVARRLAGDAGLQLTMDGAGERYPYLQQSGESDWEFLVRVADDSGCWVRPTAAGVEVRCGFDDRAWELLWGANLLALSTRCRMVNPGYKGAAYQPDEKREHRFHAVRATPALLGGATALVNAATRASHTFAGGGDPGVLDDSSRAPTLAAFKRRLEAESRRALGTAVGVEGSSTQPALRAGDTVHVSDAGSFKLGVTGKFGLVRVTHRFDGTHYTNDFAATPWASFTGEVRPARPLAPGFVSAEVVDNRDPEHRGRLRVRYRWQEQPSRTLWVRVAAPYAGNGRGVLFLPEPGDEVVIAFEQGDPERPCVMGSVWNGKDRAPGTLRIVTRSGNTLRLSDEPGKELAEIHTSRGTCLVQLSNDAGGVPTITLHTQGDLALEATGEIRMRCRRLVQRVEEDASREVGGDEAVKIGGGLKVATGRELGLSAGTDASVHAAESLETIAGATHSIAGAMVQIQPPGHVRRAVQVTTPAPKAPLPHARPVPAPTRGTSTSDARTPRAGERRPARNAIRPPQPFRVTRVTAQGAGDERGTSIRARKNTTVTLTADRFTRPPAAGELEQVRWGVRIGSGPVEAQGARGQQFQLRLEEKHDGRQVRVYAFRESPSEQVSAAIQVGDAREWMPFAERELNVTEIRQPGRHNPRILEYHRTTTLSRVDAGNDETPWCSSFVNWVMTQAGYRGTNNALAVSWLRWGRALEEPRRGAIMVVRRKSRGGDRATGSSTGNHVGFFVRSTATHFTLLGGNQGGGWRVTESDYRRESYHILGCRWPD
jgi:uncharacterized protein (TIGR02594 family)